MTKKITNLPITIKSWNMLLPEIQDIPFGQRSKYYDLYGKAIEVLDQIDFNQTSLENKNFVEDLGDLYDKMGAYSDNVLADYRKALKYFNYSLTLNVTLHDENHPSVATSLSNAAVEYSRLGHNHEALQYKLKAVEIMQNIYGNDHFNVASYLSSVGVECTKLGYNDNSLEWHFAALKIMQSPNTKSCDFDFKTNSINIARCLSNISVGYSKLKDYKNAMDYCLQAMEKFNLIHKKEHSDIAKSFSNLGFIHAKLGNHEEALKCRIESLETFKKLYPDNDHPNLASAFSSVARQYKKTGDNKRALDCYQKSFNIYSDLTNSDNFSNEMSKIDSHIQDLNNENSLFEQKTSGDNIENTDYIV
ncbi:MAG TPA: tetratricopeptide repeat protein [Candidatus Megaira endosymbiont of Nemacystus decipiens]|nr:tetratricopeptide repeat protein [Candidatus Megaera endosymbiont of Nemacystus decipiens]